MPKFKKKERNSVTIHNKLNNHPWEKGKWIISGILQGDLYWY